MDFMRQGNRWGALVVAKALGETNLDPKRGQIASWKLDFLAPHPGAAATVGCGAEDGMRHAAAFWPNKKIRGSEACSVKRGMPEAGKVALQVFYVKVDLCLNFGCFRR